MGTWFHTPTEGYGRIFMSSLMAVMTLAGCNVETMNSTDGDAEGAMAAIAFVRFLSECIPQAAFAIDFANAQDLSHMSRLLVYVSIAFSLSIAFKSFCTAATFFFCKGRSSTAPVLERPSTGGPAIEKNEAAAAQV